MILSEKSAAFRGQVLKLLRDEFQDLGALPVDVVRCRRFALLLGFRLDRSRNGFVKKGPHGFFPSQGSVFDQRPIERDNGAERRHRVCRVVEWLHFTLSEAQLAWHGLKGRNASLP